jgi:ankyrin repeat protein
MPKTLDETYERILGAIDDIYFDEVRTALEWLAFSERPVSVAELAETCSIHLDDSEEPFLEEGGHDALVQLFGVISSLVMVNIPARQYWYEPPPHKYDTACYTQYVRLAHFSVKEYLVSNRLHQSHHARLSRYALRDTEVHRLLSRSCCEYLLYFAREPQMQTWYDEEKPPEDLADRAVEYTRDYLTEFFPAYPLLPYVCHFWFRHQALAETGIEPLPTDGQLHVRVLDDNRARFSWLRLLNRFEFTGVDFYEGYNGTTALYWASALGLRQTTLSLLCDPKSSQNVRSVGGIHHTALQAAAYYGYERVVEILITSGTGIESKGGQHGTALVAAARNGHEKTVEILITSGADVNCWGRNLSTALIVAAQFGHKKIVEILIASGADVNCWGGEFSTALIAAAFSGHEKIVEILITSGADVECQGDVFGTALIVAAYYGHEKIVEILIASGADVNCWGGIFGTALIAAASCGHEKTVEILIASGADIEYRGGMFGTTLIAAVYNGRGNIVSKLLQAKMGRGTLNYKTNIYGTALELAAANGDEHIVNKLLQAGADRGEAILKAAAGGHGGIVSTLLHADVDTDPLKVKGQVYVTALEAAAQNGDEHIVENLLQAGVGHGEAIMKAALEGHEGIVRTLMKHGADLNVRYPGKCKYDDPEYPLKLYLAAIPNCTTSLLDMATLNGSDDIVEELLEAGANSDTPYETLRKWREEYRKRRGEEYPYWDREENRKWIEEFKKSWDTRVKPIAWILSGAKRKVLGE